ncbi:MAG: hypothetical protein KC589_08735 [Nanoarchaeota archaeon]|nr:hypothetical protein [Nanoarchaeota archaeon]
MKRKNKKKLALILLSSLFISNNILAIDLEMIEGTLLSNKYVNCAKFDIAPQGFDKSICIYDINRDGKGDLSIEYYIDLDNGESLLHSLYYKSEFDELAKKINYSTTIKADKWKREEIEYLFEKMKNTQVNN